MNIEYVIEQLKTPSTWAGIVAFLTASGVQIAPELQGLIGSFGSAVFGILCFFIKEKKGV